MRRLAFMAAALSYCAVAYPQEPALDPVVAAAATGEVLSYIVNTPGAMAAGALLMWLYLRKTKQDSNGELRAFIEDKVGALTTKVVLLEQRHATLADCIIPLREIPTEFARFAGELHAVRQQVDHLSALGRTA